MAKCVVRIGRSKDVYKMPVNKPCLAFSSFSQKWGEAVLNKDLIDYTLDYAKNKKLEYVEVRAQSQNREEMVLKNGDLEAYATYVDSGFSVRILTENGLGFASTNKWTKKEA